jgi:hypothetical protein
VSRDRDGEEIMDSRRKIRESMLDAIARLAGVRPADVGGPASARRSLPEIDAIAELQRDVDETLQLIRDLEAEFEDPPDDGPDLSDDDILAEYWR